ncbi:hypothetical protein AAHH80_34565, partial [Burkholderia pseudomallei]
KHARTNLAARVANKACMANTDCSKRCKVIESQRAGYCAQPAARHAPPACRRAPSARLTGIPQTLQNGKNAKLRVPHPPH